MDQIQEDTSGRDLAKLRRLMFSLLRAERCRRDPLDRRERGHYHRWRNEFGGLKLDQVKRLKELELETADCGGLVPT